MPRVLAPTDPALVARLARHREAFATSLVGAWTTASGTFDAMMSERWEFRADGTLHVEYRSVLQGTEREVRGWRQPGPWRIQIGDPPDEEEPWWEWSPPIAYEFALQEHDAGQEVVLRSRGHQGFWRSAEPLRREGGLPGDGGR